MKRAAFVKALCEECKICCWDYLAGRGFCTQFCFELRVKFKNTVGLPLFFYLISMSADIYLVGLLT